MNKSATYLGVAALLVLGAAAPAAAQDLTPGTWTGSMAPPGAAGVPVTFDVGEASGSVSIVMRSAQVEGEMPFQDVRIEGGELKFWWDPGVRVNCTLERTPTGGYEGPCAGVGGPEGAGRITMVPPDA
ncbi:MAG TPA: hypothetical protein VM198_05770 [Longimicrobiales bacterium]|nr:hypothetical protein [Longimicrobiales bacterium]